MKNQRIRKWVTERATKKVAKLQVINKPGFVARRKISMYSIAADPATTLMNKFPAIARTLEKRGISGFDRNRIINNMAYFYVGFSLVSFIHDSFITTIPYMIFSLIIYDSGKSFDTKFPILHIKNIMY